MLVEGCSDNLRVFPRLEVGERDVLWGVKAGLKYFMAGKPRQTEVREDAVCQSNLLAVGVSSSRQCKLPVQPSHGLQRELLGMSVECRNIVWRLN